MKINVLDSNVYNRISAGEVIDRTYSVVKELVENSIDACATNIVIEIIDGGLTQIKVIDNGLGIEKSEIAKAFLPHATSKLSCIADLDTIDTLGFRGEAIPSIASVSKMRITSSTKRQTLGATITCEGGVIGKIEDCAFNEGTTVTVDNLFFNAPVRAKFLKSAKSEESEIISTVSKFILGNYDVAFKLISNNKTVLQSFGDGLESAFVSVYGASILKDCFKLEIEKFGIYIEGYASKTHFSKPNRSYQTTFVNGRYVVNPTISSAISNAYMPYLMRRQYPFFVLRFVVPTNAIDVNVHPNKIDVKFLDNQAVYTTVYNVINQMLKGSFTQVDSMMREPPVISTEQVFPRVDINDYLSKGKKEENYKKETVRDFFGELFFKDSSNTNEISNIIEDNKDYFLENKAFLEKKEKEEIIQQEINVNKQLKLIGQALNTYLVLEDGVDLYLIDQHAAHERLLFDKLNENLKSNKIIRQPLLIPYIFNVNNTEYDFLISNLQNINKLGIELEEFGDKTFKVSELPVELINMNLKKFFDDILSDLNSLKNISLNSILLEKLEQKACKSAIKSGDSLSNNEIEVLLKQINGNIGLKCPHGRPICVKITRTEIDKWFKRII